MDAPFIHETIYNIEEKLLQSITLPSLLVVWTLLISLPLRRRHELVHRVVRLLRPVLPAVVQEQSTTPATRPQHPQMSDLEARPGDAPVVLPRAGVHALDVVPLEGHAVLEDLVQALRAAPTGMAALLAAHAAVAV